MTALRAAGPRRVAVDLDDAPWRVLPLEPVLAAGLEVGVVLDRPRARRLRRELRTTEARRAALTALDRSDQTTATLRARLERRGVAPAQREETITALTRTGLVDDERFARERAAVLARRGAGDLQIRHDLERRGIDGEVVREALAGLDPEPERARALVEAAGWTRRAVARLGAKGFSPDTLEALVADFPEAELG